MGLRRNVASRSSSRRALSCASSSGAASFVWACTLVIPTLMTSARKTIGCRTMCLTRRCEIRGNENVTLAFLAQVAYTRERNGKRAVKQRRHFVVGEHHPVEAHGSGFE